MKGVKSDLDEARLILLDPAVGGPKCCVVRMPTISVLFKCGMFP